MKIPAGFTRAELLEELERELRMRTRLYPDWVKQGKLTGSQVKTYLARLTAIQQIVLQLPEPPPAQGSLRGIR